MLKDLLRAPLPDQLKALLETIDSYELGKETSSLRKIEALLGNPALSVYERWVIRNALRPYYRKRLLDHAMMVVLNKPDAVDTFLASTDWPSNPPRTVTVRKKHDHA